MPYPRCSAPCIPSPGLPKLRHLRLAGNPLSSADQSYVQACFDLLPMLITIDGMDNRGRPQMSTAHCDGSTASEGDSAAGGHHAAPRQWQAPATASLLETPHLDEVRLRLLEGGPRSMTSAAPRAASGGVDATPLFTTRQLHDTERAWTRSRAVSTTVRQAAGRVCRAPGHSHR